MSATVGRVPRPRGTLTPEQMDRVREARTSRDVWEHNYREVVVALLSEGASFSEVSKATGLSTNTLQRWKREAGK